MLVLSRKLGEKIVIGDNIVVTVVKIDRNQIRIGIEAPHEVPVYREEISPARIGAPSRRRASPPCHTEREPCDHAADPGLGVAARPSVEPARPGGRRPRGCFRSAQCPAPGHWLGGDGSVVARAGQVLQATPCSRSPHFRRASPGRCRSSPRGRAGHLRADRQHGSRQPRRPPTPSPPRRARPPRRDASHRHDAHVRGRSPE